MKTPLLQAKNITKEVNSPEGVLTIVSDINLSVNNGQAISIVGPSGSGKTSLLAILAGLDLPSKGQVWLADQEITSLDEDTRAQIRGEKVGFVFQSFHLLPRLSAVENVMLGLEKALGVPLKEAKERATKQLEKMGLSDKINAYPGTLSGGQQQRVALARALALEPALIMFDEATSALDAELVAGILEEMRRLAEEGMTMIVVTHEIGFARKVGDRLLFMDQGVVVEEGIPQEVLNNPQHPETQAFLSSMIFE